MSTTTTKLPQLVKVESQRMQYACNVWLDTGKERSELFRVTVETRPARYDERSSKQVVYVGGDVEPEQFELAVRPAYDDSELLWRKYNKLSIELQKLFLNAVIQQASKQLNFSAATKYAFSRKAGCSCGCSPGFIAKEGAFTRRLDVWIDITKASK